jgi:hypothetical protein
VDAAIENRRSVEEQRRLKGSDVVRTSALPDIRQGGDLLLRHQLHAGLLCPTGVL